MKPSSPPHGFQSEGTEGRNRDTARTERGKGRKEQWELLQEEGGNDLTEYRKSMERICEEEGID